MKTVDKPTKPLPKRLFSIGNDAKTSKGEKLGYTTGVLYLAPADVASQYTLCPFAEIAGCKSACLYSAGRGSLNSVQRSRLDKTLHYLRDRDAFMQALVSDVRRVIRYAERNGNVPLIRLNGTSDIRFETIPVTVDGIEHASIMHAFPNVQFYDYTKNAYRDDLPANYDLTFSYSGTPEYAPHVRHAVARGMRVAVVFRHRETIPSTFLGMRTIDGDDTDVRHADPHGVVVALYAKGAAKRDRTGFVVDVTEQYTWRAAA